MRSIAVGIALAFACSVPATLVAQRSGGHGGGHSSGHSAGHGSGHGGSHGSSGHASGTRGSSTHGSSGSGSHGGSARRAGHGTASGTSATTSSASGTTPGARPRDGRPIVGTAIPRTDADASTVRIPSVVTAFNRWPYYQSGFRFNGLGLYRYPSLTGYGYWWPDDWYGYPWPAEAPPAAAAPNLFDRTGATGKLRFQVEPRIAQVFVDGYYAGIVDDFDGVFQRLTLSIGPHHVVIHEPGYESLEVDVIIEPHQTTTYRGVLSR